MNLKNTNPDSFDIDNDDWDTSRRKKKLEHHTKAPNTFRYESFSEKLKKIKVRLSSQYDNENCYLEMKTDDIFSYTEEGII